MYAVRFVRKDVMPEGHDWVLVKDGRDYYAIFDRECVSQRTIEEAWAAYRLASSGHLPRQRVPA